MDRIAWLQCFAEGESPAAEGTTGTEGTAGGASASPAGPDREVPGRDGGEPGESPAAERARGVPSWEEFMAIPANAARLRELLDGRARDGAEADSAREAALRRHFAGMLRESEQLRQLVPDFDIARELQNPEFLRRTLPESGMSLTDAFFSLHHGEILRRQAEAVALRSRADAAAALRLGERPRENGASATAAASGTPDLRRMSRKDKIAYIRAKYPRRF